MIQRSQSRKRKSSSSTKTKFQLQFPKQRQINRTTLILKDKQKQNLSVVQNTFVERVGWVIETKDYTNLGQKQIQDQYNKLRRELQNINIQVQKALQKIDVRIIKKPKLSQPDPLRTLQITDKQAQNNNAIIDRLRKQYVQLQKRASTVSVSSKDELDQQIEKAKGELQKVKAKIRQLKMKNKSIGDSIMNSDGLYQQIKRLQTQKQVNQRKKMKLQAKTDHVYQQISTSQLRLEQISDNFTIAQNYFAEYYGKTQQNEQQKELQYKYQHAKHCLEVINRKNQSSNNSKQQKYHILLKNLQAQMNKINLTEQKTASIELQILHCKKLILQLQQIYKQNQMKSKELLNQDPIFFTEFQSETVQKNDKMIQKNGGQPKIDTALLQRQSVNQRNKTQNKQNLTQTQNQTKNKKVEQANKQIQKPEKSLNFNILPNEGQKKKNGSISKQFDEQEQGDIIMQLDEKFKYKTKSKFNMRSSRYEKDTEIGQDLPQDIIDQDDQIMDFKEKITEEKVKRKSKQGVDIINDLNKIQQKINKFEISNASKSNFSQQEI